MGLIKEYHTSDLGAECFRYVYHRHKGEVHPQATTALVRGLAAGAALEMIHNEGRWSVDEAGAAASFGMAETLEKLVKERRPITDAVERDLKEITDEVATHVGHYIRRQGEYFQQCKLIGCEVPIRWWFDIPGREEPASLASHLDLLYVDPNGELVVRDFKWHEEAAGFDYLGRSTQMSMYHLMIRYGEVKIGKSGDADFDWHAYGIAPAMEWFDLRQLKVYQRKTTSKNWDGTETTYEKGEDRPIASVCRRWQYADTQEQSMREELAKKITMLDAGLFLMNPGKIRCSLCDAKKFCPCWHREIDQ